MKHDNLAYEAFINCPFLNILLVNIKTFELFVMFRTGLDLLHVRRRVYWVLLVVPGSRPKHLAATLPGAEPAEGPSAESASCDSPQQLACWGGCYSGGEYWPLYLYVFKNINSFQLPQITNQILVQTFCFIPVSISSYPKNKYMGTLLLLQVWVGYIVWQHNFGFFFSRLDCYWLFVYWIKLDR